jgi:hypothetical protein
MDQFHHLAKVRVAGSNPVFRSIVAGQVRFFKLGRALTVIRFAPPHGVRQPATRLSSSHLCSAISEGLHRRHQPHPSATLSKARGDQARFRAHRRSGQSADSHALSTSSLFSRQQKGVRTDPHQERAIGTDEMRVSIIGWASIASSTCGS